MATTRDLSPEAATVLGPATVHHEMTPAALPVPEDETTPPGMDPGRSPMRQPLLLPASDERRRIAELENLIQQLRSDMQALQMDLNNARFKSYDNSIDNLDIKPMNGKDMKAPPDYDGSRKNFASWHESFISMLTCKTPKWQIILDWLKSRKEQKIHTGTALAEFREYAKQYGIKDTSVETHFDQYQKQLYRYLLDYTKEKQRMDVMAMKEKGVFEAYRTILHKGLNISEEKRLDVEAKVLNPRKAKTEKDILTALQEWRADQEWLLEAGFGHAYSTLHDNGGKLAQTVLIKMMPSDGGNSIQKYLRECLASKKTYDELEEELHRELGRREDKKDMGGLNQLNIDSGSGDAANTDEKDEFIERVMWDEELGWINALVPNPAKRSRASPDDETPQDSKIPRVKGSGKKGGARKGPGVCWQCGADDHFQADCPQKGQGKAVPLPSAWSSWKPATWPGPTATQWRSFAPRIGWQKGKGKGKGKGKSGKGNPKGKGKDNAMGEVPMQMGYFGSWNGFGSNWDNFGGDMGLLTKHSSDENMKNPKCEDRACGIKNAEKR